MPQYTFGVTKRRPRPSRPRRVVLRIDPADYARLEQLSLTSGVELETLARQMIVDTLNRRRWLAPSDEDRPRLDLYNRGGTA